MLVIATSLSRSDYSGILNKPEMQLLQRTGHQHFSSFVGRIHPNPVS
jgi:hypothetical protein